MPYRLKHGLWLPAAPAIIRRRAGNTLVTEYKEENFAPTPGAVRGKQVAAPAGGNTISATFIAGVSGSAVSSLSVGTGTADANRYILSVIFAREETTQCFLSSATINGAGATQVWNARRDGTTDLICAAYISNSPITTGTSATTAVTFSTTPTPDLLYIANYRIISAGGSPVIDASSGVSGSGTTSTSSLTGFDTTGLTPFVIYALTFSDETAALTIGGSNTLVTSPTKDVTADWGASTSELAIWSDASPAIGGGLVINGTSSVSTVWAQGAVVLTAPP